MSVKRGALIVLEGCDRSGKTTQCKQLVASLLSAGGKAQYMNFPNRSTPSGRLIDEFLRNKSEFDQEAIHLLFTVNRWECKRRMEELLLAGTSIVVDRYSYSGVAYSVAKGLSLDWCKNTEANLLKPDLVLLLSLSDEAIQRRGGFGAERYETPEIQRKVSETFKQLHDPVYWQEIDADRSVDELQQILVDTSRRTIDSIVTDKLALLW